MKSLGLWCREFSNSWEEEHIRIGVPKETFTGESRVALIPAEIARLAKRNLEVTIEAGAGIAAGFPDTAYTEKGATIATSREALFKSSDIIVQVRTYPANTDAEPGDLNNIKEGQVVVGMMNPLGAAERVKVLADSGATAFAMELIPRITRAQSMDVLSSMATLAGYKAVLIAANLLPRLFPMMMTAAGTLTPARIFVLGVGVAGLQAIATAKRLGGVVEAYDIRPEVKEQVQSVGGKFLELDLTTNEAGDGGGYAKAQSEEFYRRQRELMTKHLAGTDVVITTAAVPGRRAPILVTEEMVRAMRPGSLIVDLAAETGGNCEVTRSGEDYIYHGVRVIGPVNVPSAMATHASQMYARNIATFLDLITTKEGELNLNMEDEIVIGTLVTQGKQVVHERVQKCLEAAS